jgi:hypothetical protein
LAKYDREGTLVWGKQFGTPHDDLGDGGAATDSLGNVYVLRSTRGNFGEENLGNYDVYLSKFNADGGLLWTRQFGAAGVETASYVYGGGLAADGLGNVYFAASIKSTIMSEDTWLIPGAILVGKYDRNGEILWGQELQIEQPQGGVRVAADGHGNVYVAGITTSSPSAQPNAFVAKIRDLSTVPEPSSAVGLVTGLIAALQRAARRRRNQSGDVRCC